METEQTLVLIKPDGVERGLIGAIITRFEQAGLKIGAMKLVRVDETFAKEHYSDLAERRGEEISRLMIDFLVSGPVVALVLEGVEAIALVRKMVGETEPKTAQPGTIRGDFAHVSYGYANAKGIAVKNIIHASSSETDAKKEIPLWFSGEEIFSYEAVHERHTHR